MPDVSIHIKLLGEFVRMNCLEDFDIHLPNKQSVSFTPQNILEAESQPKDTKLTAWFKLNTEDNNASQYTYLELPQFYVWNNQKKVWTLRQKNSDVISPAVEHHECRERLPQQHRRLNAGNGHVTC